MAGEDPATPFIVPPPWTPGGRFAPRESSGPVLGDRPGLRRSQEDAIEEQVEGPMGLGTEGDPGREHEHLPLPQGGLEAGHPTLHVILSPRPATLSGVGPSTVTMGRTPWASAPSWSRNRRLPLNMKLAVVPRPWATGTVLSTFIWRIDGGNEEVPPGEAADPLPSPGAGSRGAQPAPPGSWRIPSATTVPPARTNSRICGTETSADMAPRRARSSGSGMSSAGMGGRLPISMGMAPSGRSGRRSCPAGFRHPPPAGRPG